MPLPRKTDVHLPKRLSVLQGDCLSQFVEEMASQHRSQVVEGTEVGGRELMLQEERKASKVGAAPQSQLTPLRPVTVSTPGTAANTSWLASTVFSFSYFDVVSW